MIGVFLGRVHAHLRNADFRPDFWDAFGAAIISCALDEPILEVQEDWRKIVLRIVYRMKTSYQEALSARLRNAELVDQYSALKAHKIAENTLRHAAVS